ncbi:MAG: ligase-associated DNA damage response endonuclease PdeM [Pseudodonghicola sp.]|nr:ligase-associated DNA damage response endonuclease PdeM [Pseudodonghicola sp.]
MDLNVNGHSFTLAGVSLVALGTGALWRPEQGVLCVADLHLGKSERIARHGSGPLPAYDTRDTLTRLAADLTLHQARTVICLGHSFDDLAAARALPEAERAWIATLQAGRRWVWVEGRHDVGPADLGGTSLAELPVAPLSFRPIARPGASGEVSGHYHPSVNVESGERMMTRPAFLLDRDRVILPAYGIPSAGQQSHDATLRALMRPEALALLTGPKVRAIPMPR